MSAHAKLSASGAHRWLTCPPSAALEAKLPDPGSQYADEGTLAHKMAETMLVYNFHKIKKRTFQDRMRKLREEAAAFYTDTPHEVDAMERNCSEYAAGVWEIAQSMKHIYVDLEQRVDFSDVVPGGFGTADVVLIGADTLHVIDLKYGKGVPVSAEKNPQLMLYAYGAMREYEMAYDFSTVYMTIIQPRLNESSTDSIQACDLIYWAENAVKPRAELAESGGGDFNPTEEACRFCRARAVCCARGAAMQDQAAADFGDDYTTPETLTPEAIASILAGAPRYVQWYKDVEAYALEQVRDHGAKFDGWKLVEGRSVRKIEDAAQAQSRLENAGYTDDDYLTAPELLGITALERNIGAKTLADLIGDLIEKPPGKPVLVPDTDKRPEISSTDAARGDFTEEAES